MAFLQKVKPVFRPELAVIAYAGTRPIGIMIGIPDYNRVLRASGGRRDPVSWLLGRLVAVTGVDVQDVLDAGLRSCAELPLEQTAQMLGLELCWATALMRKPAFDGFYQILLLNLPAKILFMEFLT